MAKVRQLYTIKNDVPETLTVFIAFVVNPLDTSYSATKIVMTSSKTALDIVSGERYVLGQNAFLDPEDALQFLRKIHVRHVKHHEGKVALIDAALEKLKEAKEAEKNAK